MAEIEFKIEVNNIDEIKKALESQVRNALEAIGAEAERIASGKCPTDTGLLKNSITHAVSGEGTAMSSYRADRADASGEIKSGGYTGTVGGEKEASVYIGTNVEYAPYVELGTSRQDAQPFLKPAIEEYAEKYKEIAEKYIKGD